MGNRETIAFVRSILPAVTAIIRAPPGPPQGQEPSIQSRPMERVAQQLTTNVLVFAHTEQGMCLDYRSYRLMYWCWLVFITYFKYSKMGIYVIFITLYSKN